jgi:hypothetical protein
MTSGKRLAIALGIGMLTLFGSLSAAQAQYGPPRPYYAPPPPPRGVYRSGLVLGGSLGVGEISSDNCGPYCGGTFFFEGHIGGMLNPRLALMADLWGAAHRWDDGYGTGTTYQGLYTLAAQYWVADMFWLKGGVGFAQLNFGYDNMSNPDENGPGILAAAGFEVVQAYNFALDLQLRLGHGFYDTGPDVNQVAFMVGANWY